MELAVFADCRILIENFVQNGNPRFESFCVQWKFMMFQHIFSAQSTTVELLQTTAAALHLAKRTVCGKTVPERKDTGNEEVQLMRRIGGMYLMYAIYFKQPTWQYVKVEVSPETWTEIQSFLESLPITPTTDEVRYVFWKLVQANAFRFTALDYCAGLEQLVDYDRLDEELCEDEENSSKLKEELHEYNTIQKMLPALTVLEDGYNEMKEILTATGVTHMDSQTLPPTTIFKEISRTFQNIQEILDAKSRYSNKNTTANSKKRGIKAKGYKIAHSTINNEMNTAKRAREDDEEDDIAGTSRKRVARRMSARTVFSDQLPADLIEDLNADKSNSGLEETDEDVSDNNNEYDPDYIEDREEDEQSDDVYSEENEITLESVQDTKNNIKKMSGEAEDSLTEEIDPLFQALIAD